MNEPLTIEEFTKIREELEEEIDLTLHPDDDYFTWNDETEEEI